MVAGSNLLTTKRGLKKARQSPSMDFVIKPGSAGSIQQSFFILNFYGNDKLPSVTCVKL